MFFELLSILSVVLLLVIFVLFQVEKSKSEAKHLESKKRLIEVADSIKKTIFALQDETQALMSDYVSESNDKFLEITSDAVINRQELEEKLSNSDDKLQLLSINAEITNKELEKKISNSHEMLLTISSNAEANNKRLEEKIRENLLMLHEFSMNTKEEREALEKNISESFKSLTDQVLTQTTLIRKLREDNEDLRRKLAFFTEIGSDSAKLNEDIDYAEEEKNVEQVIQDIRRRADKQEIKQVDQDTPKASPPSIETSGNIGTDEVIEPALDRAFLDPEQIQAYISMEETNNNLLITGKAGTGKSFLLQVFEKVTGKKTLKVSPTGISALNIGGTTLHSAFGFHNLVRLDVQDINKKNIKLKSENRYVLQNMETLIIDEVSMIRADTFDKMDRILRILNNNDVLFGGKQIIVFGDLFQLPPIANREEQIYLQSKYGGIFFFHSDAYKAGQFHFIELGTNHRQKTDNNFFQILNRMREGNVKSDDISSLNQRVVHNYEELSKSLYEEYRRILRLYPRKKEAEDANQVELDNIPAREYTFEAKILYKKNDTQVANGEGNYLFNWILKLKLGAVVMMINNDPGKRWVNGTLGIVSEIRDDMIKVRIKNVEYEISKHVFESLEARIVNDRIEYEAVLQIEQYPMVLGYAITIHKSQGKTYPRIACDISECFAPGQAYVALSRCTSLDGLHLLKEINDASIDVDSEVRQFYVRTR